MHARLALVVAFSAALAGCRSGKAAETIQSAPPKIGSVDPSMKPPSIEACKSLVRHDVMVVDWTPELRSDLEAAMKEGVALVSYDCKSLKLVGSCSLEGSYSYIGTTRREKQIEMSSGDEIVANLPVRGLSWLSEVGAKLDRERALVAKLVMVGKHSATRKEVERRELQGACDSVTHFMRAATVGAFVVASGSKAELGGTAKILGKGAATGSESSTKIQAQDGDLEACEKSKSDDPAPPDRCGAVVRIELEPVGVKVPESPELMVPSCAPGFAMADGLCVSEREPHQCDPDDAQDCTAQCDAGDAPSCATLAVMYKDGVGVPKDWAKAAALAERACGKDVVAGCRTLAAAKLGGEGTARDPAGALALLDKACQAGDGMGCVELGVARLADKQLARDAQFAFRRACYGGGEPEGCALLGSLYAEGKGDLGPSPKIAVPFFERGCREGSMRACDNLGELLKSGKGVARKDPERARALFEQACNGGYAPACKKK